MILKCTCEDEYQDKKHGKGKRVHNKMKKMEPQMKDMSNMNKPKPWNYNSRVYTILAFGAGVFIVLGLYGLIQLIIILAALLTF